MHHGPETDLSRTGCWCEARSEIKPVIMKAWVIRIINRGTLDTFTTIHTMIKLPGHVIKNKKWQSVSLSLNEVGWFHPLGTLNGWRKCFYVNWSRSFWGILVHNYCDALRVLLTVLYKASGSSSVSWFPVLNTDKIKNIHQIVETKDQQIQV